LQVETGPSETVSTSCIDQNDITQAPEDPSSEEQSGTKNEITDLDENNQPSNVPQDLAKHAGISKGKGKEKASDTLDEDFQDSFSPKQGTWADKQLQTLEIVPPAEASLDAGYDPGPSTGKKSKALVKAEKAYAKRNAKFGAKAKLQEDKQEERIASGNTLRCSTCGGTDHQRRTSKLCQDHTKKRKPPKDFKRTSVVKTSLANTCRSAEFVRSIEDVVKHIRDVTYVGSLFANFFFVQLLSENQNIPPITHDLCYSIFSMIAGEGKNANESLQEAYLRFKVSVPEYKEAKFRSRGYMTIISSAAKEYEEAIRNHLTANFEPKTIQYLLVRMSDDKDETFRWKSTVAERRLLANF
ncbi:hypothetical protein EC973_008238, partial [Apophysomyces ossiformis]